MESGPVGLTKSSVRVLGSLFAKSLAVDGSITIPLVCPPVYPPPLYLIIVVLLLLFPSLSGQTTLEPLTPSLQCSFASPVSPSLLLRLLTESVFASPSARSHFRVGGVGVGVRVGVGLGVGVG